MPLRPLGMLAPWALQWPAVNGLGIDVRVEADHLIEVRRSNDP